MFFLLNDVVLNLDTQAVVPPVDSRQLGAVSLDAVIKLASEQFAADPQVHHNNTERAKRLAALIVAKAPTVNAALFVAPVQGCSPSQVACRYAQIGFDVMGGLYQRQQEGVLTSVQADREVWSRVAAA
jgi:hypothetical protein